MPSSISHITVDARDAYAQSVWWGEVLQLQEDPDDPNEPGDEECAVSSAQSGLRLLFVEVPDSKQLKNRLHFDLRPLNRSREDEVTYLLGHGAFLIADRRRPDGTGWFTLGDPEGNEFCVLQPDSIEDTVVGD